MAIRRICFVGLGSIGQRHLRLLSERKDIELELYDANIDSIVDETGLMQNYYMHQSFNDMIQTKPDIVVISTPHSAHSAQTIEALDHGIHVFCEKPMSNNSLDASKMIQAAKRSGKLLNIGFQLHFHDAIVALREIIQTGTLGKIFHIHCKIGTYKTLLRSKSRYQAQENGALIFDYSHQVDLLHWFLGKKPEYVITVADEVGDFEFSSNPNIALMTFGYREDLFTTIHLNYIQCPERHEYEVIGDKGWAILNCLENYITIGLASTGKTVSRKFNVDKDEPYRKEWDAFFEALNGNRDVESSAEDAFISTSVCEGALQSWESGRKYIFT